MERRAILTKYIFDFKPVNAGKKIQLPIHQFFEKSINQLNADETTKKANYELLAMMYDNGNEGRDNFKKACQRWRSGKNKPDFKAMEDFSIKIEEMHYDSFPQSRDVLTQFCVARTYQHFFLEFQESLLNEGYLKASDEESKHAKLITYHVFNDFHKIVTEFLES